MFGDAFFSQDHSQEWVYKLSAMQTHWLYLLLGFLLLSTAVYAGASLRGGSRLQRRLFLLFLVLSFLPSTAILYANWRINQHNLGCLDSPGLRAAFESSLHLARSALEQERLSVRQKAESISDLIQSSPDSPEVLPPLPPGWACRYWQPELPAITWGEIDESLLLRIDNLSDTDFTEPIRLDYIGQSYLATIVLLDSTQPASQTTVSPRVQPADQNHLLFIARLDQQLSGDLLAITEGNLRFRQLRLYYGSLLKNDTLLILAALGLLLLIASLLLSRYLASLIGAPVQELARGAAIVAGGNLDHQVQVAALDEINDLVLAFNRMTRDLKTSEHERKSAERIAAWQGIARRLAHEIKNPLTPIGLSMHRIRRKVDDADVIDCLDTVVEETENLRRLADEFSMYARLPAPEKDSVNLIELIETVVDLYAERTHLDVQYENWCTNISLSIDSGQIRQVFANIIKNAVESMGSRGTLTLRLSNDPSWLTIVVQDTGPGFSGDPEDLFEPYFTTKEAGTGLGLAIARKIMIDHGGMLSLNRASTGENIDVVSGVPGTERGAAFSVAFPLTEE